MRSEIPYTIHIEFDQRLVLVGSDTVHKDERSVIEDDPAVIVSNQDHQVYFARSARAPKHYQTPVAGSYPKFAKRKILHNGVALAVSRLAECRQWGKPRHDVKIGLRRLLRDLDGRIERPLYRRASSTIAMKRCAAAEPQFASVRLPERWISSG